MKQIDPPTRSFELTISFFYLRTDLVQLNELLGRKRKVDGHETQLLDLARLRIDLVDHTDVHRHT